MKRVRCEDSGVLVPKDKAVKRFQVRNIVDASAIRDLQESSTIDGEAQFVYVIETGLSISNAAQQASRSKNACIPRHVVCLRDELAPSCGCESRCRKIFSYLWRLGRLTLHFGTSCRRFLGGSQDQVVSIMSNVAGTR